MRNENSRVRQFRRTFDQLFQPVVDSFAKFGRNDDSFDDALPFLIGELGEVCCRAIALSDTVFDDARADSQQFRLVGFDCLSLPGRQHASLNERIQPDRVECREIRRKHFHPRRAAAKIAGRAKLQTQQNLLKSP